MNPYNSIGIETDKEGGEREGVKGGGDVIRPTFRGCLEFSKEMRFKELHGGSRRIMGVHGSQRFTEVHGSRRFMVHRDSPRFMVVHGGSQRLMVVHGGSLRFMERRRE